VVSEVKWRRGGNNQKCSEVKWSEVKWSEVKWREVNRGGDVKVT
jgi:hypothetical protein